MSNHMPSSIQLHPASPRELLVDHYVGRKVEEVDAPAAILDVSLIKRHCEAMITATQQLGWAFRAHVKSHKVCRHAIIVTF